MADVAKYTPRSLPKFSFFVTLTQEFPNIDLYSIKFFSGNEEIWRNLTLYDRLHATYDEIEKVSPLDVILSTID